MFVVACGQAEHGNWTAGTESCALDSVEAACVAPVVFTYATKSIEDAPAIEPETTYSVESFSDGAHSYVVFTPARSGLHTIYFGTEDELRVCDLTAVCASTLPCPTLRVAAQYAMDEGIRYEIELPGDASDFRLRVEAPPITEPPEPMPATSRIVFAAALDGQTEPDLYTMNSDGTDVVRLTTTSGAELYPSWSPARDRIAFVRDFQLFVRNADGSNERLVAPEVGRIRYNSAGGISAVTQSHAAWSPDGTQLVYPHPLPEFLIEESPGVFVDESYGTTLHIVAADGTGDHAVPTLNETQFQYPFGTSYAPVWGSDDRILFAMDDDCPDCAGGIGQGSIRPDGTGFIDVGDLFLDIRHGLDASAAGWVFVGELTANVLDFEAKGTLYTAPAYGTERTELATAPAWGPRWSPDATSVAYITDDGVYVIGVDGAGAQRILPVVNVRGLDW